MAEGVRRNLTAAAAVAAQARADITSPLNFTGRALSRIQLLLPESRRWIADSILREGRLVTTIETDLPVGFPQPLSLGLSIAIERFTGKIEARLSMPGDLIWSLTLALPPSYDKPEQPILLHPELLAKFQKTVQTKFYSETALSADEILQLLPLATTGNNLREKLRKLLRDPGLIESEVQHLMTLPLEADLKNKLKKTPQEPARFTEQEILQLVASTPVSILKEKLREALKEPEGLTELEILQILALNPAKNLKKKLTAILAELQEWRSAFSLNF